MINKNNIETPYPGIMIFRNGLENPERIIDAIDAYENWEQWYNVGQQITINPRMQLRFRQEKFPTEEQWNKEKNENRNHPEPESLSEAINILEDAFFESTSYYFEKNNFTLPNWMHAGSNILKYNGREATEEEAQGRSKVTSSSTTSGEAGGTKNHTLPFHTDFNQEHSIKIPNAEYTITIYLNDDYVGGEIDYRIFNGTIHEMDMIDGELVSKDPSYGEIPKIAYRPKAGDIIIFPSRPPYYHGVRRVESGIKKFVRMFWMSENIRGEDND